MLVREASVPDAADIARVHVQVWREAYVGVMRPELLAAMDAERITPGWTDQLASPADGVRLRVAEDADGAVAGYATAGPSRDDEPVADQELYVVNLLARAHGTGLGEQLLDAVVRPGSCSLWVVVGNDRAIAFFERLGFVADGRTYWDERRGVTQQRMVRAG